MDTRWPLLVVLTLVLWQPCCCVVGLCEPYCLAMNKEKHTTWREVVEHDVLFNMPNLQFDEETLILQGLHDIQFEFEGIFLLLTGRLLTNQSIATHAIVVRFPSTESLVEYYSSSPLHNIAAIMTPFLSHEYTVDYTAWVTDGYQKLNEMVSAVHITFVQVEADATVEAVEDMIQSLLSMAQEMDYITQFTAGANNYIRDETYSHAFTVYLSSVEALERFAKDPSYVAVLDEKVLPICSETTSVDFLPYKPAQSAL